MHLAPTVVRGTTLIVSLVTAVATTLVLSPAPAWAWGFTEPAALAPAGAGVTLSADGVGNAAAAWVAGGQVLVSLRPFRSRTWTPAVAVSPAGEDAAGADVSVGPGGDVAVTWTATPPGLDSDIKIAQRSAGQAWGPARDVSENAQPDSGAQVSVGAVGVATVVWVARNATEGLVRTKTVSATSMSPQVQLADLPGTFSGVSLARGANGDSVAAWRYLDAATTSYSVQARRRVSGGDWGPVVSTGPVASVPDAPSAAVDGGGNATLGWVSGVTPETGTPFFASWPRGGALGAPTPLGAAPGRQLELAATSTGGTAAAWLSGTGVMYADLGGAPQPLTSGVPVSSLSLALSDTGAATVSYAVVGGGLGVAHRPVGAAWATQPVAAAAGARPLVVAHGPDATMAWTDGEGGPVSSRTLDDLAPTAVHLTAPMRPLNVGTRILAGWIGDDLWSPIRYEVQRQVAAYDGDFAAAELWRSLSVTDAAYPAEAGQTVCLKVRGVDQAGNAGPWSVARCATTPVNDRTLRAKGWQQRKGKGYFSGDYVTTRRRGSRLVLPGVQARRLALLVAVGRGNGTVSVSLGKKKLGSYSFAAHAKAKQVVVPVATFAAARTGRLEVTVTSDGRPVRIDGVYAGR